MCGIYGSFGFSSSQADIASKSMRRRGPDGHGSYRSDESKLELRHLRLSIIDPTEAGNQPMITANGRVVMVFNGEIYNFKDLRLELEVCGYKFKSDSDSEVLLNLFERDGASCFNRLNGVFAAAFWEVDVKVLTLVRDPLGVKPLYIHESVDGFAFSSELKALLRSGVVKPELNPNAVLAHLGFLWSPGRSTIVKGASKVLPGHVLRVESGKVIVDKPFRPLTFHKSQLNLTDQTAASSVELAISTAVSRQMVSDVPLGAFLSGGLDSSAVAVFAQSYLQQFYSDSSSRMQCYTIALDQGSTAEEGFAEDLPYARRVAKHLGVDLHEVTAGKEMMHRLPEMIYLLDEPTPDPAALNTLLISELARSQGIKVLLSGAGGDDIFTGYRRHFALMQERWWSSWPQSLRQGLTNITQSLPVFSPLGRRVTKAFQYAGQDIDHRLSSYFLWINPAQALNLLHPSFRESLKSESIYDPMLQTLSDLPLDLEPLNRMLYLECKHFLADHNLNYTDKMGMAAGVEIRVPLLDLDLVDLAGSLPINMKQRGTVGKWIFKKAMEPYLPNDIIYRPKTGFGVPLRHWLQTILKPLIDDVLSVRSLDSRGIFDSKAVQQLRAADQGGRIDATYTIFSIVCLELWCRQYIDGVYAVDREL